MKKLLIETRLFEFDKKQSSNGNILLSGVIQRANSKNHNGRIYPRDILAKEIKNYETIVNERRALGELDHTDESIVELKNVSHIITKIWWEGDDVCGEIELLNTPNGKIAQTLVNDNIKLGISSRAVGSIKEENGASYVQSDLVIVCWDLVSDPSTKGAFLYKEAADFSQRIDSVSLISEGKKQNLFSKEYKVNRILNEIICGCADNCTI